MTEQDDLRGRLLDAIYALETTGYKPADVETLLIVARAAASALASQEAREKDVIRDGSSVADSTGVATAPTAPEGYEAPAHWAEDCLKWRHKVLTGRHAHWCFDWDDLPVDETCPEWPCGCAFQRSCEEPDAAIVIALRDAVRLYETYGLLAQSSGCGRWVNSARDALKAFDKQRAVPAVATPSDEGKADPSRIEELEASLQSQSAAIETLRAGHNLSAVQLSELLAAHRDGQTGESCSDINDPGSCNTCNVLDIAIKALSGQPPSEREARRAGPADTPPPCSRCDTMSTDLIAVELAELLAGHRDSLQCAEFNGSEPGTCSECKTLDKAITALSSKPAPPVTDPQGLRARAVALVAEWRERSRVEPDSLMTIDDWGHGNILAYRTCADELASALALDGETRPDETPAPEATEHELKTWPMYYGQLVDGTKTFEYRRDDRGFDTGDTLYLREWDPDTGYTGREMRRRVTSILVVSSDYVVMSLQSPAPEGRPWQPIRPLYVGDVVTLGQRRVRVVGDRSGFLSMDSRGRVAVRNVDTGRLSYMNERQLLKAKRTPPPVPPSPERT
jgi:hypothetical protein